MLDKPSPCAMYYVKTWPAASSKKCSDQFGGEKTQRSGYSQRDSRMAWRGCLRHTCIPTVYIVASDNAKATNNKLPCGCCYTREASRRIHGRVYLTTALASLDGPRTETSRFLGSRASVDARLKVPATLKVDETMWIYVPAPVLIVDCELKASGLLSEP